MTAAPILDLDVSAILQKLEKRYHLKLLRKVVASDCGSKRISTFDLSTLRDP